MRLLSLRYMHGPGEKNETPYRVTWIDPLVRKRGEFSCTGQTSADAHCRLLVR
jgi:hypothetical protein